MNKPSDEAWLEIADHERYSVSNLGRVMNKKTGRILMTSAGSRDRRYIGLLDDFTDRQTTRLVGNLVWWAFVGPIAYGLVTTNSNGDPGNDAVWNLDLVRKRWHTITIWDKETNKTYNSVRETSQNTGVSFRDISTAFCSPGNRFEIVE